MRYSTRFPENANAVLKLPSYSWKKILMKEYSYVREPYHCLNPRIYSELYPSKKAGTALILNTFS